MIILNPKLMKKNQINYNILFYYKVFNLFSFHSYFITILYKSSDIYHPELYNVPSGSVKNWLILNIYVFFKYFR